MEPVGRTCKQCGKVIAPLEPSVFLECCATSETVMLDMHIACYASYFRSTLASNGMRRCPFCEHALPPTLYVPRTARQGSDSRASVGEAPTDRDDADTATVATALLPPQHAASVARSAQRRSDRAMAPVGRTWWPWARRAYVRHLVQRRWVERFALEDVLEAGITGDDLIGKYRYFGDTLRRLRHRDTGEPALVLLDDVYDKLGVHPHTWSQCRPEQLRSLMQAFQVAVHARGRAEAVARMVEGSPLTKRSVAMMTMRPEQLGRSGLGLTAAGMREHMGLTAELFWHMSEVRSQGTLFTMRAWLDELALSADDLGAWGITCDDVVRRLPRGNWTCEGLGVAPIHSEQRVPAPERAPVQASLAPHGQPHSAPVQPVHAQPRGGPRHARLGGVRPPTAAGLVAAGDGVE